MARDRNRLTDVDLYALPPGWHADGGVGLYLRVKPTGTRSWVCVDTRGGVRRERGLGTPDLVTIEEARAQCRVIRRRPVKMTFGELAKQLHADLSPQWRNEVHRGQWISSLKTHAAGLWDLPLEAIDTEGVVDALRPVWTTTPATARRVRARIEQVLAAAIALGHRKEGPNPAAWAGRLEYLLPRRPRAAKRHHGAVPWEDMPALWAELDQRDPTTTVRALQFTILTAARRGEVIRARVREFDRAAGLWTIPAERTKAGVEHRVPLSSAASAVVTEMAPGLLPEDYIFPGARRGSHLSDSAMFKLLRVAMGRRESVHGFRSSFRDFAGDATDYPREVAEMALGHTVGDAAERAYRRGRALEKRRGLMDAWADYLVG